MNEYRCAFCGALGGDEGVAIVTPPFPTFTGICLKCASKAVDLLEELEERMSYHPVPAYEAMCEAYCATDLETQGESHAG